MARITVADVRPILRSAYNIRDEIVPCFIGAPGIGKTDGIRQFAKEKGVSLVTFILSNTIPSEVSGIRMPDPDTKELAVFDDARMASLKDGDILFFDEILEAPRELWSACLTLIQSREMASGRKLPDVMIVAASNPISSPVMIPASVRDRFMMLEVEWDEQLWIQWFEKEFERTPTNSLVQLIRRMMSKADDYNILTPRRVAKLCKWLLGANKEERVWILKSINSMFDETVSYEIDKTCKEVLSLNKRIQLELDKAGVADSIINEIKGMTYTELLQYLKEQAEWPEIRDLLAGIEVESDDDEVEVSEF